MRCGNVIKAAPCTDYTRSEQFCAIKESFTDSFVPGLFVCTWASHGIKVASLTAL